jgi:glycosyltransferase involved in cell wall biosynthesis
MSKKITYLISDIDRSIAFEWIVESIDRTKFELSFILFNNKDSFLEKFLIRAGIKVKRIPYSSKKDLVSAVLSARKFLKENNTEIIHSHLFDATFIGMIAAKLAGIKRRIYTRHYAALNHRYFPTAVRWDKKINRWATDIVAVSELVKEILVDLEKAEPSKISLIHHGFKLNDFKKPSPEKVEALKQKYNSQNKRPTIGVISRFIELKGVEYIIPAFKEILRSHPDALLLLFNAKGDQEEMIHEKLKELPATSYKTVAFEEDIVSLYHLFDVFIHVPITRDIEAFGQTYVESLAAGIPLVATASGVAAEFLVHEQNALLVPFKNAATIEKAVLLLLGNEQLRKNIIDKGYTSVAEKFDLRHMIRLLESLYLR